MPAALEPEEISITAADIVQRFGPIPLHRIRRDPPPGTAKERDVVRIHDHEGRLYELVDGILVEKAMGFFECLVAARLLQLLRNYLDENPIGEALPGDTFLKLVPGLVRAPDVSFFTRDRLRAARIRPHGPMPKISPNLAIEVISKGNTKKEMQRKLRDYFKTGTQLVWMVYPVEQEVKVYTSPNRPRTVRHPSLLDGGRVLPGLEVSLADLFAPVQD